MHLLSCNSHTKNILIFVPLLLICIAVLYYLFTYKANTCKNRINSKKNNNCYSNYSDENTTYSNVNKKHSKRNKRKCRNPNCKNLL